MLPKPTLLILSDLWGSPKADYLPQYIMLLAPKYKLQFLDCCQIGQIDTTNYQQENLHEQFVNSGIETAVDYLLKNYTQPIFILAFRMGGTIAWKAMLKGLNVQHLWAVSATRLRYEIEKPSSSISLIYGELDAYHPQPNWFNNLGISDYELLGKKGHGLYRQPKFIQKICEQVLRF